MPSTGLVDELGACNAPPDAPPCNLYPLRPVSMASVQVPFIVIVSRLVVRYLRASACATVPPALQFTVTSIGSEVTPGGTGIWALGGMMIPCPRSKSARLSPAIEVAAATANAARPNRKAQCGCCFIDVSPVCVCYEGTDFNYLRQVMQPWVLAQDPPARLACLRVG